MEMPLGRVEQRPLWRGPRLLPAVPSSAGICGALDPITVSIIRHWTNFRKVATKNEDVVHLHAKPLTETKAKGSGQTDLSLGL